MTAANQIAQTIISDSYFLKLYRVCVERSVLRTLNIDTEEKYTEKEIRDLLRFADLLSTSSISDARNYAYKIITYLNPYYKDNVYYHTVAKAVYSNLGNFPAISYLEADNNNTSNLPFDRSVQNEAKKLIQEVPDGVGHVFTDIQYDLFSKLISSREFSFSGPTSMGKSFVIKAFLRCAIQNTPQENFIILVPSRALINQYAIELKSEMGALLETNNYKIVTNSNIAELPINEQCNYVLILTPERLISYISQEKNPSIGFLFVDEAHKLAQTEDARSITTYTSIEKTLKKYPDIKLYFASPNVSNPEILLSMFRNGKAENTFKTQETPRGIENGNRAGLRQLLRIFRALVNYAKDELHMYGANPTIFEAATEKMAWGQFESKAVNPNIIRRMEFMDRSLFSEQEQLCLDLFLFSFYSGGMANVDVVNLTWDMINEKEGMIVYERTKFPKLAKPLLIDRLIIILEKYRGKGVGNYVFPVYTEKHITDKQKMGRRNSFSTLVSETLDKVCEILGINEKMTWYTARGTFISSELDAGTPITHVAEMAGNSARTIEKHYYKNTKQDELRQRMNARYGNWGQ